jgi:hypothetical protein
MPTRSEIKAEEARQEYLANARLILNFCIANGIGKEKSLAFSVMPLEFNEFVYFFNEVDGNVHDLKIRLEKHVQMVEQNRLGITRISPFI